MTIALPSDALTHIEVIRSELHERLLQSYPEYKTLSALDDLLKLLRSPCAEALPEPDVSIVAEQPLDAEPVIAREPEKDPAPQPAPKPLGLPKSTELPPPSKQRSPLQAVLEILRKKDSPASLSWLLNELEQVGVKYPKSPKQSLVGTLNLYKNLFRKIDVDGRFLWGLKDKKYACDTDPLDRLRQREFKSMRVRRDAAST